MAIEEALNALLLSITDITDLVGSRIYPMQLPQDFTLPAVTYQRIAGEIVRETKGPAGKARPLYQVDAWGETPDEARDVGEAIRIGIDGYSGTVSTIAIHAISLQARRDFQEQDMEIYRRSQDYLVSHTETLT